jgi:hypothetical protein
MSLRALAVASCLLFGSPAWAATDDIPENLQGKWVDQGEACDYTGGPIVISATTLVYSDGKIDDVFFAAEDGSDGAIHHRDPGDSADYAYVAATDMLLFHPEGLGAGSAFSMVRCQQLGGVSERRCGWLAYITPGNWQLVDADRTWVLSERGDDRGATIPVMDMVPHFDLEQYVSTGTYYGYGCACMTVTTDGAEGRVLGIASSRRLPLATCEADRSLPPLSDW